jgi:hypothetical protein
LQQPGLVNLIKPWLLFDAWLDYRGWIIWWAESEQVFPGCIAGAIKLFSYFGEIGDLLNSFSQNTISPIKKELIMIKDIIII